MVSNTYEFNRFFYRLKTTRVGGSLDLVTTWSLLGKSPAAALKVHRAPKGHWATHIDPGGLIARSSDLRLSYLAEATPPTCRKAKKNHQRS